MVHVVLEDYGQYDGGATIRGIYADKQQAERVAKKLQEANQSFTEYRIESHRVRKPKP